MRAFVTGGTGFLGRHLVEQLTERGWQVTCLHRAGSDTRALQEHGAQLAVGSLRDPASLREAIPSGTDVVFHVAGNTSTWTRHRADLYADNVEGTRAMLSASRHAGVGRFVHTSTWNTFGLDRDTLDETVAKTGASSSNPYTQTKTLAEQAVLASGQDVVVMNPSHILGRYDAGNWARLFLMVHAGKVPGVPPGAGSFCWAPDVAAAHIAAAERGQSGANYLLGGTDASWVDVFTQIGALVGKPAPRRTTPAPVLLAVAALQSAVAGFTGKEPQVTPAAARMLTVHPRITSTKAADDLGYTSTPLEVMLRDTYDYLVSIGKLPSERPSAT